MRSVNLQWIWSSRESFLSDGDGGGDCVISNFVIILHLVSRSPLSVGPESINIRCLFSLHFVQGILSWCWKWNNIQLKCSKSKATPTYTKKAFKYIPVTYQIASPRMPSDREGGGAQRRITGTKTSPEFTILITELGLCTKDRIETVVLCCKVLFCKSEPASAIWGKIILRVYRLRKRKTEWGWLTWEGNL